MNKNELCNYLSLKTQKDPEFVHRVVSELLDVIKQAVISGDKVTIQQFGSFEIKKRSARIIRTFNGQKVSIRAYKTPIFKPSTSFKRDVKQSDKSTFFLKLLNTYKRIYSRLMYLYRRGKIIGTYDFKEQEYNVMVDLLGCALCENNISLFGDKFAFSTLLEICKKWKNEDNISLNNGLYVHLSQILNQNYDNKFRRAITDLIDRCTHSGMVTGELNSQKHYYSTLMMHALAPKASIYSLFELCFNIYKADLGFNFDKNENGWIIPKITEVLQQEFSKTGDTENKPVQIGSSQYSIQIGLRCLVLNAKMHKEFELLLHRIFSAIDTLFHNDEYTPNKRNRIDNLIYEWWQEKNAASEFHSPFSPRRGNVEKMSKLSAKYVLNRKRNCALLYIPSTFTDSIEDVVIVSIFVNGGIRIIKTPKTRKGELFVETSEVAIELNSLLEGCDSSDIDVRVTEVINGKLIFDSSNTLKRHFILFDEINETKSSVNPSTNYILYSRNPDTLTNFEDKIHTVGENLYSIYPQIGDILNSGTQKVFFIRRTDDSARGNDIALIGDNNDIVWKSSPEKTLYGVFSPSIKLLIPNSFNINSLEIRCENFRQNLSRMNFEELGDGSKIYDLSQINVVTTDRPISIDIYSYQKQKTILSKNVYLLDFLTINFNKQIYYGDKPIKANIAISGQQNTYKWENDTDHIAIPYKAGEFLVTIPNLKWRTNNREWHYSELSRVQWFKDFLRNGELLEIQSPGNKIELYFITDGNERCEVKKNTQNTYPIGHVIYAKENKRNISVFASIQLNDNSKVDYPLFHISTTEYFIDAPVIESDGMFFWKIENSFVGSSDNKFKLFVRQNNEVIDELPLPSENKELDELRPLFDHPGDYLLSVKVHNAKSIFGGTKELWQKVFTIDHPETIHLKGKKLQLIGVVLFGETTYVNFEAQYEILNLKFDETRSDETTKVFTGLLYKDGHEINYMFDEDGIKDEINPIIIEFCDKSSAYIFPKSEEAFYYDKWEKSISNRPGNKTIKYDDNLKRNVYFEDNNHYHLIKYFKFIKKNV